MQGETAQAETAGNGCTQAGIKMYVKMKKQIYKLLSEIKHSRHNLKSLNTTGL